MGTLDLGVGSVAVQREAVVRFGVSHEPGDASKAPNGEALVVIIMLKD